MTFLVFIENHGTRVSIREKGRTQRVRKNIKSNRKSIKGDRENIKNIRENTIDIHVKA